MSTGPLAAPGCEPEERPAERSRRRWWASILLIVLAGIATYGRTLPWDFLGSWDDDLHVTANPGLLPPSLEGAASFWREPYGGMYVPVTYSFLMLEAWAAGGASGRAQDLDARVFRLGSIALHAAAAVLVLLVLRALGAGDLPALAGALLFELHPLQVEAVAWISETRGLLAAVLGLGALVLHLRAPTLLRRLAALLLFALALLAKPSAACLPLIALVLDGTLRHRRWRVSLLALVPWFALVVAATWTAKRLQPDWNVAQEVAWWQRPWIAADALAFYLGKLVAPLDLVPDLGRTPARVLGGSPWPALAATGALLVALLPRWPSVRASVGVFVAGLTPTLGLVSFEHQDISTVASRFAYLAMLGPALALTAVTARWGRRPWVAGVVALLLLACGAGSAVSVGAWRDLGTLFERNLQVRPDSARAHVLVGLARENDQDLLQAAEHYREALRLEPGKANAHLDLGNCLLKLGRIDEGLEQYQAALRADPRYALAHDNSARALLMLGRPADALPHLRALVELSPDEVGARRRLARALWRAHDPAGAAAELERALALAPGEPGLTADLAWLLATTGQAALRDADRALELVGELRARAPAAQRPEWEWIEAAALAAKGQREDALTLGRAALQEAVALRRSVLSERLQAWVQQLETGELPPDPPPLPNE